MPLHETYVLTVMSARLVFLRLIHHNSDELLYIYKVGAN